MNEFFGRVVDFDETRGDGHLESDDGRRIYFHCIGIADGTRRIDVGARVSARRVTGHRGADEATDVRVTTRD